jgi:hypothetical protein
MQKPTIMVLGTYHMANPGRDVVNVKADDVLTPKRQREIEQLVELLKNFKPTKIAVEVASEKEAELQVKYQNYLNGSYQLGQGEGEQIGFRLAKKMGHNKVYPVDWNKMPPVDIATIDYESFAETSNQKALLEGAYSKGRRDAAKWEETQKTASVIDLLRSGNQDENIREGHKVYFTIAQIGFGDQYIGANWVQCWYGRNLKIFVNLTRITESPDDRILLVIGSGHLRPLQHFNEESGYYIWESPLKYLNKHEIKR